mmetsp:Transcript_26228/g.59292  ORF Transcript_26228/g.59292 Transcript_26228/m.59292 type:complete len:123 (+) Transcript_26228:289-657(+)
MVLSRCAMTMVVWRPRCSRASRAACTTRSLVVSSADVASSRIRICGLRTIARAMAMRCFCPPERATPRSPTSVSYPWGNEVMKSCALACFAAVSTSSLLASRFPYVMFSAMLPLNSTGSCPT